METAAAGANGSDRGTGGSRKSVSGEQKTTFVCMKDDRIWVRQRYVRGMFHRFNWHRTVEVMLLLSGGMEVFANGASYILREDDVLLLGQNCGHALYPLTDDCVFLTTEIAPGLLEAYGLPVLRYGAVCSNELEASPSVWMDVRQELMRLTRYLRMEEGEPFRGAGIDLTAASMIADLYHSCSEDVSPFFAGAPSAKRNDAVENVKAFIEEHYSEKIQLDTLADLSGYNRTYTASLFKKQEGIGVYEYIVRTRMQNGLRMLGSGRESVTDIALRCGFSDSYSFSVYAKKYCGRTPQEYRALFAEPRPAAQDVPEDVLRRKAEQYLHLRDDARLDALARELRAVLEAYVPAERP